MVGVDVWTTMKNTFHGVSITSKIVLSASRRTEMLHFPRKFAEKLEQYPPEKVHTIVLWTKTPQLIFNEPIRSILKGYNLFIHCTITGLGGTFLEPNIPKPKKIPKYLDRTIDEFLDNNPNKIHVRFDPILNLIVDGEKFTNLPRFPEVVKLVKPLGIRTFRISWATYYRKVRRRLKKFGIGLADFDLQEQARYLVSKAEKYDVELRGCCVDPELAEIGFENSACINGKELQKLHPNRQPCRTDEAKGQRKLCKCTHSLDIGWYSMKCPNGCVYCYANPKIMTKS